MKTLPLLISFFIWTMAMATRLVQDFEVNPQPSMDKLHLDPDELVLTPMSPAYTSLFNMIMDKQESRQQSKRDDDDSLTETITGILNSVKDSNVITTVLHDIADSTSQMNNLSSDIYHLLTKVATSGGSGLNISLDFNSIYHQILESGLIQNTVFDLFYNDTLRNQLADGLNKTLSQFPFIVQIINNLGHNQDLTFDMIFETARNFKSKAPQYQTNASQYDWLDSDAVSGNEPNINIKRDELDDLMSDLDSDADSDSNSTYSGSLTTFVNNLLGSAVDGGFANETFDSILKALDNSGIAVPVVLLITGDLKVQRMIGFIANKLYNYGVFDAVLINPIYQKAKKTHILARGLEYVVTNELYSKPVALILERIDNQGGFDAIRRSLHGPQRH